MRPIPEIGRSRVGLLGGSFNPAHEGHLHISRLAIERLGVDWVWWLVSPQNPLKPAAGMAPLEQRLRHARKVVDHPRIRVTDIERDLGTRYTADSLSRLRRLYPRTRFAWLMGADNLLQIPDWHAWREIFRLAPVAVFGRATYSLRVEESRAARIMAPFRIRERDARGLSDRPTPAWVLLHHPLHAASATRIRDEGGWTPR